MLYNVREAVVQSCVDARLATHMKADQVADSRPNTNSRCSHPHARNDTIIPVVVVLLSCLEISMTENSGVFYNY